MVLQKVVEDVVLRPALGLVGGPRVYKYLRKINNNVKNRTLIVLTMLALASFVSAQSLDSLAVFSNKLFNGIFDTINHADEIAHTYNIKMVYIVLALFVEVMWSFVWLWSAKGGSTVGIRIYFIGTSIIMLSIISYIIYCVYINRVMGL